MGARRANSDAGPKVDARPSRSVGPADCLEGRTRLGAPTVDFFVSELVTDCLFNERGGASSAWARLHLAMAPKNAAVTQLGRRI
jgi:hypothetical protein